MSTKKPESSKSTESNFTKPPEVDDLVKNLRNRLGVIEKKDDSYAYTKGWSISDLWDDKNRQYIDLVQKGGGVWGIALVGFTYVLEELGIRFLRLAGTSAGSINTLLLVAIDNKEDKKSEKIVKILADKNIYDFVDGHKVVRWFFTFYVKFQNKLRLLISIPIAYLLLLFGGIVFLISPIDNGNMWGFIVFLGTITLFIIPLFLLVAGIILYHRIGQAGFGLNPGEDFLFWLREVLWTHNRQENRRYDLEHNKDRYLITTKKLEEKVKECPALYLIKDEKKHRVNLEGDFTLITSDLVTKNKIELPRMKGLFISTKVDYQPFEDAAEMVRASMAIPIFFESFYARNINREATKREWCEKFYIMPPEECRFVDGGIMSNFPINIYFDPSIENPRLPTIGINLEEDKSDKKNGNNYKSKVNGANQWKLFDYIGRIFNASKNYYDNDFIHKNEIIQKSIANVHIKGTHWLHFGMSDEQKGDLFMQGAKAAYNFLAGDDWSKDQEDKEIGPNAFDWNSYKSYRKKMAAQYKNSFSQNV